MSWSGFFDVNVATALRGVMNAPPPGSVAAFDSDGTLWDGDLHEELLKELSAARRLPAFQGDVFAEYTRRLELNTRDAYVWAMEVMAGLKEEEVLRCSADLVARWKPRVRPAMKALVAALQGAGVPCAIVSGTNAWTITAAAQLLGIPKERAFGMVSVVKDGVLTSTVPEPVTYGAGKVARLHQELGRGWTLALAVGDGMTDLPMLEAAGVALVVGTGPGPDSPLERVAAERGYLRQRFGAL